MEKFSKGKDLRGAALTPASGDSTRPLPHGWGGRGSSEAFLPGSVFAGRFRMITLLGFSDSGDVWQAEDLVLQSAVALKIIRSSTPEDRDRILTEVRLARQITHPAVRRVFDVGEVEGRPFCSMELVEGEDLGRLLRRVGRLPSEKVLEIAIQLCDGLEAGHAQGVLHRHVRPENVLIDDDGLVRLTDFGIAATSGPVSDAEASPYIAPEQRSGQITERSDLYGLGILLYELLVGAVPSGAGATRPKPSTLVGDVDQQLERTIMRAIDPNPRHRPVSAAAMRAQLTAPAAAVRGRLSPWLLAGGVAGGVLLTAFLVRPLLSPSPPPGAVALSEQDTVVIADVMNTTGEVVFDGALKVALEVALEQSPFLNIVPDERVRDTLQLMQRAPDEPVTRALAREIARRERAKVVVAGSIGSLGTSYVLSLEAVDAETGDVLAREQTEVARREDVLSALGEVSSTLRTRLGESLALVERFDAPLPRATTASLEALQAYALALDQGRVNPRPEAIPYLRRALELDPDFAMAHAQLSGVYANTGRFAEAPAHARRAFELRDRVSERERYFISWRYYVDAAQAWDMALDVARSWTATYPREAFAFNSVGLASAAFGEHEQAATAFREAVRLDPRFVPPYGNLAGSLIATNRLDDARAVLDEASQRGIATTGTRRGAILLAWLRGDQAALARELDEARATADVLWVDTWQARVAASGGRFSDAHALYEQGARRAVAAGLSSLGAQWMLEDAELDALAGACPSARQKIAGGLALGRDNFALERASRAAAYCGAAGEASLMTAELSRRYPEATLTSRVHLPVAAAAAALRRGDAAGAVARLEPVRPYDYAPSAELWPLYLRGQAYLALGNGSAAAAQFGEITRNQGKAPTSPLFALAHLGLARAVAMAGDRAAARDAYGRFLLLWGEADADLPDLLAGRRESADVQ